MGDMDQFRRDQERYRVDQARFKNQPLLDFFGTGQKYNPGMEYQTVIDTPRDTGMGGFLQQGRMGPLSGLGQYINQELEQQNQGEVDEFIGEVGDMANQRFGVDLGSVGQRPMFRAQGGPVAMENGGDLFAAVTGVSMAKLQDLPIEEQQRLLAVFKERLQNQQTPAEALSGSLQNLERDTAVQEQRAANLSQNVDARSQQIEELNRKMEMLEEGVQGMQMGGSPMMAAGMPMPPQPAPPMQAPEQAPMPMEEQLDPNVVQQALSQAAGGIASLDEAQNYEDVMNSMRGDQASVEQRRGELAGVVGPEDASQTPESVLTLVQPVMMLANVDQGVGGLAQEEMTQPMEGPMAGGIMSTVPEPPMMEADGTVPVNFKYGGEVRPVQYFAPENSRVAGANPFANLAGTELNPFVQQAYKARQALLSDPAELERQKDLTKAQILFDIAQTALAFSAPMPGEKAGLSPAERLALAASTSKLPQTIGARAKALGDTEAAQKAQDRAVMLSAITSGEAGLTAKKAADRAAAASAAKTEAAAKESERERAFELSKLEIKSNLDLNKDLKLQENKYLLIASNNDKKAAATIELENLKASNAINKEERIAELRKDLEGYKFENKKAEIVILDDNRKALLTTEFELKEALEKNKINLQMEANLTEKTKLKNVDFELEKKLIDIRADIKLNQLGYSAELNEKSDLANHERTLQRDAINNNLKSEIENNRLALEKNKLEQKTLNDQNRLLLDQNKLEQKTANDEALLELKKKESELDGKRFELEAAATKMLDVPGEDGAYVTWLSSNLDLADNYAAGETNATQDNMIELVINNLTATKSSWSAADGAFVDRPGGQLSEAWQNAINKRKEKFSTNKSLPTSALKVEKQLIPTIPFNDKGEPDFSQFKDKNSFLFNGEDLTKSFGLTSGFRRFFNAFAGQVKDITNFGSGYMGLSGAELSRADQALNRLSTKIISTARDELNGKVFALDLQLLQQDIEKFKPGSIRSSVAARDALVATQNKLGISYNKMISMINNPKEYLKTEVTQAKQSKAGLEVILGELSAAIALFERGISGSNVGAAEVETFNQPLYLTPRNNQEEELFP